MRKCIGTFLVGLVTVLFFAWQCPAWAAAPQEITIGTLYASTGDYSSVSIPLHDGLLLWAKAANAEGGPYVGAYHKRIPVRIVSYDDQSNTATVATLTNQLITQNKVDVLVSDFGSVLTSVSVPIAREHKVLLIDPSANGLQLFSKDNRYLVDVSEPAEGVIVRNLVEFLAKEAAPKGLRRIALLYSTNDFTGPEAAIFRQDIAKLHGALKIIYDKGIPTSTSSYTVLVNGLMAAHPDFVFEAGYPSNDIAFLRDLQDMDVHFRGVFVNYVGWELDLFTKSVGVPGIKGVFSFVPGAFLPIKTTAGMTGTEFHAAWDKAYPGGTVPYGLNAAIGYSAGVTIGEMLKHAPDLTQLGLRKGLYGLSGKLVTLQGRFQVSEDGQQLGESNAVGQAWPDGKGQAELRILYPPEFANARPVFAGH